MADDKRVYSEQEVGELVRRAAELQELSPEHGLRYAPGVTREQLERVAEEVGVEPEFLARALAERHEPKPRGFFREHERVVDGEIDPNDFDLILDQVPARRSRDRIPTQIGRTLSAQVWTGSGLASLEVTSRNTRTRVRVKSRPVVEIMGTLNPAFFATLAVATPLAAHGHVVAAVALAASSFAAATMAFLGWSKRSNRAAQRLADKVEGIVAAEVARQGTEALPDEERRRRLAMGNPQRE